VNPFSIIAAITIEEAERGHRCGFCKRQRQCFATHEFARKVFEVEWTCHECRIWFDLTGYDLYVIEKYGKVVTPKGLR
jgi:hypothetical protein